MVLRYLAFLAFVLPAVLSADAVRLRSGEIVVGTITGQTRDDVTINVGGKTRVIRKAEIQRVVYRICGGRTQEGRRAKAHLGRAEAPVNARRRSETGRRRRLSGGPSGNPLCCQAGGSMLQDMKGLASAPALCLASRRFMPGICEPARSPQKALMTTQAL